MKDEAEALASIVVVDDDERVRRVLVEYLTREGYRVTDVASGAALRAHVARETPDLVILDLMLPDANGLDLARELRAHSAVPIVMLTGKTDTVDKIVGLELGADDYVTKPFDQRELLARVRTVLRRSGGRARGPAGAGEHRLRFAGWKLDLLSQELESPAGEPASLTSVQFQLLALLLARANQVVNRTDLLREISGRDWTPDDRSIDVQIWRLRKKIEADPGNPKLIRTIRGIGYKLTAQVEHD